MATDGLSVKTFLRGRGIEWKKACALALPARRRLIGSDPDHLGHARVLGVVEHKWKHFRGDATPGVVTVIVVPTPQVDGTGPVRFPTWCQVGAPTHSVTGSPHDHSGSARR